MLEKLLHSNSICWADRRSNYRVSRRIPIDHVQLRRGVVFTKVESTVDRNIEVCLSKITPTKQSRPSTLRVVWLLVDFVVRCDGAMMLSACHTHVTLLFVSVPVHLLLRVRITYSPNPCHTVTGQVHGNFWPRLSRRSVELNWAHQLVSWEW